jgi:hypothetical protein
MSAGRFRLPAAGTDQLGPAVGASVAVAVIAYLATKKLGLAGLAAPLVLALVVMIVRRPLVTVSTVVVITIMFEGPSFGIPVTPDLYKQVYKGLTPLDGLVVLLFLSVASDLLRRGRQPRLPPVLVFPLLMVTLAIISGIVVGNGSGIGLRNVVISVHVLVYLLVLPTAVYNLDLDQARLVRVIRWAIALALLKAVVGLLVMAAGLSTEIDVGTSLTYYEPTANWLIMIALFGLIAAGLGGSLRPQRRIRLAIVTALRSRRLGRGGPMPFRHRTVAPFVRPSARRSAASLRLERILHSRSALLATPVLLASIVLSYRRSFWIATVLGLALVLVFASTPSRRRMVAVAVPLLAAAIWSIGSVKFQAQTPLAMRVASLNPNSLQTNAEDRYRIDERANVVAAIRASQIGGLGMEVPWQATVRPLGIEHDGGRLYVHFTLLWWWLKLGLLGAIAYLSILASTALMAFRTWRQHQIPELRYFGLASLCAVVGLVAVETTASFTGVDPRFTLLLGAQMGVLATLSRRRSTLPKATPPAATAATQDDANEFQLAT